MDSEDRLLALKERLERKVEKLRSTLSQSESDLAHVTRSIELLGQNGKSAKREYLGVTVDEIASKGMAQALVLVAMRNNNRLKTTPTRSLLIEAGLLKPSSASAVLNTTLKRLRYFKRLSRGVYEYHLIEGEEGQNANPQNAKTVTVTPFEIAARENRRRVMG